MKINIIGTGNVALHLHKALHDKTDSNLKKIDARIVNSRSLQGLDQNADLTIIAVSDYALAEVITRLPLMSGIVAHTSGSTPLSIFEESGLKKYGVFYPLQTFSKSKPLEYEKIPFYIEGIDEQTSSFLFHIASIISPLVRIANSKQRKALHIAAVLSCNFVNHLWTLSSSFLNENNLDFTDLLPLIEETFNKIKTLPPYEAQTGPSMRGDKEIINSHLLALCSKPELAEIYHLLSNSIYKTYH